MKFPKTLALVKEKKIKLYLGPVKIVQTLAGKICLVSKTYGEGYYGTFSHNGDFFPNATCKADYIELLQRVESGGLAEVASIGLLTGSCCICGRTLVAEGSIESGIGPICADKVGFTILISGHPDQMDPTKSNSQSNENLVGEL